MVMMMTTCRQLENCSTYVLTAMGAHRHGQEGRLALHWNMYRLDSLQLQHFGSHKKNQNRCHKARFTGSKYT